VPVLKARVGGAWVDVGGAGVSEVAIGPTDPGDTTTELWYDTDEPNLYDPDTSRWNSAWGVVGTAAMSADHNGIGSTVTDINGLSLTFTAVAGRRYVASMSFLMYANGAGSPDTFISDASNNTLGRMNTNVAAAGFVAVTPVISPPFSPSAGSFTVKGRASCGSTTINVPATSSLLTVHDAGPVSMSSNPPAQPASVWTGVTFLSGWGNLGSGYQACQYRLVGDQVQLRGVATATSTPGTSIFTLPVGFRPPAIYPAITNAGAPDAWERIDIQPNGTVGHVYGVSMTAGNWISLDNIQFSVTP
jgi:hypothetical protein